MRVYKQFAVETHIETPGLDDKEIVYVFHKTFAYEEPAKRCYNLACRVVTDGGPVVEVRLWELDRCVSNYGRKSISPFIPV